MILKDIIDSIESVVPLNYQEVWDNSGIQVGDPGAEVHTVLLTTDITESVVNEAISLGCQLIISHHPLLFHGLKQLCGATPQQRCVEMAIRHGIAIYSAHTNMDSYLHGVSGRMAENLGITDYRILAPANGATFDRPYGLGVIGCFSKPMRYIDFLYLVKQRFNAPWVRYTDAPHEEVQTIAMCGGSGAELIGQAIEQGADVFLSADCKYHEMQASIGRIGMVDIDHWVSEQHIRQLFAQLLEGKARVYVAKSDCSAVKSLE